MPKLRLSLSRDLAADELPSGDFLLLNAATGRWATVNEAVLQLLSKRGAGGSPGPPPDGLELLGPVLDTSASDLVKIGREAEVPAKSRSMFIIYKLTHACNFGCTYCYDKQLLRVLDREKRDATFHEVLARILDGGGRAYVLFHGGEPLLEFRTIESVVKECETRYGGRVQFSVQTNGSLFRDEAVTFLHEHQVGLSVSVDGVSDRDNRFRLNRPGNNVYTVLLKASRHDPRLRRDLLGLHLTIGPHNVDRLPDILRAMQTDGFRSVSFGLLQAAGGAGKGKWAPERAAERLLELVDLANTGEIAVLAMQYLIQLTLRLLGEQHELTCLSSPCGAGRDVIAVYPSGEVGPCDSVFEPTLLFGSMDAYHAGQSESGAFAALLGRSVDSLEPCRSCDVRRFCNGTCPGSAQLETGRLDSVDPFECAFNFTLIRGLLLRLASVQYEPFVEYCRFHVRSRTELRRRLQERRTGAAPPSAGPEGGCAADDLRQSYSH